MKKKIRSIIVVCFLMLTTASVMAVQPTSTYEENLTVQESAPITQLSERSCLATAYNAYDPSGQVPEDCFLVFDTESPGEIEEIHSWTGQGPLTGATYDLQGNFYVVTYDSSSSTFYLVNTDLDIWYATLIGSVGVSIHAMTCDPTSDIVYAAGGIGNAACLYTIDKTTGIGTLIGPFGGGLAYVLDLACDENGSMYGIDISTDMLYSIDKETGHATQIGSTGQDLNYAQDMAYCHCDTTHTLYLAGYSSFGALYTVNRQTGACTLVGQFQGSMEVDALAFHLLAVSPPPTQIILNGTWDEEHGHFDSEVTVTIIPGAATTCVYYKVDAGNYTSYTAPFVISSNGAHTISAYAVYVDGTIEEPRSVSFIILKAAPTITIKGGFGVTITLKNENVDPMDVAWAITLTGQVVPKYSNGTATQLAPGATVTDKFGIFGFGPTTIIVTANGNEETATGFVLLIFVLGIK